MAAYASDPSQSASDALFFTDNSIPATGDGLYYLVKWSGTCSVGSWQTDPGAEPARDIALP